MRLTKSTRIGLTSCGASSSSNSHVGRHLLSGVEKIAELTKVVDAEKVEIQFRKGIITDGERHQKEVEIWNTATAEVTEKIGLALSSMPPTTRRSRRTQRTTARGRAAGRRSRCAGARTRWRGIR